MATFGQAADEESPVEVPRYYIGVDVNENVTAVTKLLCLKKPLSPVKTLSVIDLEDQNSNVAKKNRNSFHQNVEEALSSLLWQPYEYQQQKAVDGGGSSCCSGSSGCSSASGASSVCDLEEATNNGSPTAERYASYTDLYRSTEMVNNLPRLDQWLTAVGSRDAERPISTYLSERILSQSSNAVVRRYSRSVPQKCNVSDMQVEVHNCSVPPTTTSVLNINATGNDGLRTAAATAVAVVPPPLSSANVVGLPRYGTVPSQQSHNRQQHSAGTIFPNHPRQQSEPSNQFRLSANNAVVPISNANANVVRHTSQMDQSNLQLISHLRSASVPKSMPVQTRTEASFVSTVPSTTQANINNTLVPSHSRYNSEPSLKNKPPLNISNINVNFYRAVPVNVVSSVPTIQCINSTVQGADVGNNVSNVQIMPLGNIGAHHLPSSAITGTTQVTVHNTPTPTHSIQIPTNFQRPTTTSNINNNQQQIIIQNNRSTSTTSTTTVPQQQTLGRNAGNQVVVPVQSNPQLTRTRTFTSTEAQTDDISVCPAQPSEQREQRRRERRERRHQRRVNNTNHRHTADSSTQANSLQNDRLPDILNSHLPPPYTTMGNNQSQPPPIPPPPAALMHNHPHPVMVPNPVLVPPMVPAPPHGAVIQTVVPNNVVPSGFAFAPHHQQVVAGQVPIVQGAAPVAVSVPPPSGFRFPFPNGGFRRGRFSEESPKSCCGLLSWKPGSLRWFIALIALVAVCCVLIGTTLGAMRPAGRDHLTVSLLMIGVGIVLVTVSGVAWRLTSHDSSTCRSMLGLGSTESVDVCTRRFVPRLPPSYGRPHHPYAAMMYPEFQYRPPPPSYQASMQEYRLRLLLLDRGNTPHIQNGIQNAVSPPPTYRSHAGSLLRAPLSSRRDAAQSEYSCPPSYRSQNSSNRQGTLQTNSVLHSREQSLSLSESNHGGSVVNVVNILGSTEEDIALDNITLDSLKMDPESDINPLKMLLKGSTSDLEGSKDGNLVTIVQTSDQNPVIVTVSGSSQLESNTNSVQITEIPSEMEILAHL